MQAAKSATSGMSRESIASVVLLNNDTQHQSVLQTALLRHCLLLFLAHESKFLLVQKRLANVTLPKPIYGVDEFHSQRLVPMLLAVRVIPTKTNNLLLTIKTDR